MSSVAVYTQHRRERGRGGGEGAHTPVRSGERQIIGTDGRDEEEDVESKTVGIDVNTLSSLYIDISFS